MHRYEGTELKQEISIEKIVSLHYFEYTKDYVYDGEEHDFWEFVCVDSGTIEVIAGKQKMKLKKNEMIFHKPGEFHALRADGITEPNLIVISFYCKSPSMKAFEGLKFTANEMEMFYLSRIVSEARHTFSTPLNHPYIYKLQKKEEILFGSEQVIKLLLEYLLICIYRRCMPMEKDLTDGREHLRMHPRRKGEEWVKQITDYLTKHVYEHMSVAQICKENLIGRSQLQKLFHETMNCGVIDYFNRLKIETAQKMIRTNKYNFAQIAEILNYSSYQYFLIQFKKYTRMTPSEYDHSIRSFIEEDQER